MAATMAATAVPRLCSSSSSHRQRLSSAKKKPMSFPKFINENPYGLSVTENRQLSPARATSPESEEDNSTINNNNTAFTSSKEDLSYLLKLGAGSVLGAAAIKYGSIVFPDITRPNIVQALIMISSPVIVAVLLLVKQSRIEKQGE